MDSAYDRGLLKSSCGYTIKLLVSISYRVRFRFEISLKIFYLKIIILYHVIELAFVELSNIIDYVLFNST